MGNILIVEDNELVRKIMVTILKIYFPNDSITEAIDGEKAMSIIKKNQPDVVVSDVKMPKKDGISVLNESKRKFPQVSFIIMSGSSGYRDVVESLGAVFIEKPFDFDVLTKMIKKKLEK